MKEVNLIAGGKTYAGAWRSGCAATAWKEHLTAHVGGTVYRTGGTGWCGILEDGST